VSSTQHHEFKAGDLVKLTPRAILTLGHGPRREAMLGILLIVKELKNSKDKRYPLRRCFRCISPICAGQRFILYSDELTLLE